MNRNLFFTPTDILLPAHTDMRRWSVIACDQFTADAGYWQTVQDTVGDAPSTLRLMLPEFYLGKCDEGAATREIQQTMHRYLDGGVFRTVPHSLVLVQRTLPGGATRCGIVGALDLEAYDYAPDSVTPIRATEGTVASRLPARVRIRAAAALEMPHIMVFYSDPDDAIFRDALAAANETLYDFDLMSGGGHVRGLRVAGMDADALAARLCATGVGTDSAHPMRFAIADGSGYAISLIAGSERRDILAKGASLGEAIAAMDTFCAAYLAESGGTVDYIHGDDEAIALAAGDGCCGILMPRMDKAELFTSVLRSGPFPKKSFSIGLGADKRYYLECRKL